MKREHLLEEYVHFRAMGFRPEAIPARLGISGPTFYRAMRRARLDGDPRAAGDEWLTLEPKTSGTPKLSFEIAEEIRAEYAAGGVSYTQLAERYGVDKTAIGQIVRRLSWTSPKPPKNTPKNTRRAA